MCVCVCVCVRVIGIYEKLDKSSTLLEFWCGIYTIICLLSVKIGGARGVVVIVVGNGHGDTSSNPGRDWLYFTS